MSLKYQILTLIQSGNWLQAKTLCAQLCGGNVNDPEAWFLMAGIHAQLGAIDEVIACCRRVVELQTDNIAAHYNLGVALQSQKRHEEAAVAYREVLVRDANHALAYANLGSALREVGKIEEAVVCCRHALQLQPMLVEAYNTLGLLLIDQGKYGEGASCLRQALAYRPGYAEAYYNLGLCHEAQNELDEAANCHRQAIGLRFSYAEAHGHLGSILATQGRPDEAITHYRHAVAYKKDYVAIHAKLSGLLQRQGRNSEAAESFHRLLAIQPDNARAWASLGSIYEQLDRSDQAISCLRRAIDLKPDYVRALMILGAIFQKNGALAEARSVFERVLHLEADQKDLEQVRYFLAAIGAEAIPVQSPAEYIKDTFDSYAEKFEECLVNKLGYQIPGKLFDAVAKVQRHESVAIDVIDLGCGTGLCGELFRPIARRLVGVDLSPKMLEQAKKKNAYDELIVADVIEPLRATGAAYDLVIAADVFVYIGDLANVFDACRLALKPDGLFVFSIEALDKGDYILGVKGRYAHSLEYIRRLANDVGLAEVSMDKTTVRQEMSKPVPGIIFVLKKTD